MILNIAEKQMLAEVTFSSATIPSLAICFLFLFFLKLHKIEILDVMK